MSKKNRDLYKCTECHYQSTQWLGRCPQCGAWNSLVENVEGNAPHGKPIGLLPKIFTLSEIEVIEKRRTVTGISEIDRVLGGGFVSGTLCLLGGEPGVGKSTLLMTILKNIDSHIEGNILYASGEESAEQVGARALRLNVTTNKIKLVHETQLEKILECIEATKAEFVVIDSIQTTYSQEVSAGIATPTQTKEVTYKLMEYAKKHGTTFVIIGHITKDGSIAGPKLLEHMVDVVLYLEGRAEGAGRTLRSQKNRFGDTKEIGLLKMNHNGFSCEGENLVNQYGEAIGRCLSLVSEGSRDLVVDFQALTVETATQFGRRVSSGFDLNRLNMIIAIAEKYLKLKLGDKDIYLKVGEGMKVNHPDADLAVMMAIVSSIEGRPFGGDSLFVGEVSLCGEIKKLEDAKSKFERARVSGAGTLYTNMGNKGGLSVQRELTVKNFQNVISLREHLLKQTQSLRFPHSS